MLAIGPPGHALAGKSRPLICLSNRGDHNGEHAGETLTAGPGLVNLLLDNITREFAHEDIEVEIEGSAFRINDPFRGGYIISHHAGNGPLSWIQLELSRALYLPERFSHEPGVKDWRRLADLRTKLLAALKKSV